MSQKEAREDGLIYDEDLVYESALRDLLKKTADLQKDPDKKKIFDEVMKSLEDTHV